MESKDLYDISQIRLLEALAINTYQIAEFKLMATAGKMAFDVLRATWPTAKRILVLCGQGNNGGDGYVLARHAYDAGLEVSIRYLGDPAKYTVASREAYEQCKQLAIDIEPFHLKQGVNADILVDALLGIGLKSEVRGDYVGAINYINEQQRPVLAIDVPSGLNADTGAVLGIAVKAASTVTFIGLKQGLFTSDGVDYAGQVVLADLNLPADAFSRAKPSATLLSPELITENLPIRKRNSNKGLYGHVLILGGNKGMAGAARLAAEAALRSGSGLVSVATYPGNSQLICAHYPEIMCHEINSQQELSSLIDRASVLVVGPGLGTTPWSHMLLEQALKSELPIVIDADGLNLLGVNPLCGANWILTPHPGEAARILGTSSQAIQANRFEALRGLTANGGTWVLKGAGTLIGRGEEEIALCPYGNPGMASGGMGDALSGIIGGLLGQHLNLDIAAKVGVLVHALSGDFAANKGERGLLASDLISAIRKVIN